MEPETNQDTPVYPCSRCGVIYFSEKMWYLALRDGRENRWCPDCNRTPQIYVEYRSGKGVIERCIAWRGEYDQDNEPIDQNGFRFAGKRALCGHRDCVVANHRPDMKPYAKGGLIVQVRQKLPETLNLSAIMQAIENALPRRGINVSRGDD